MTKARYIVGIDLGTTHSVVAASAADRPWLQLFDIPQLVAPAEIAARPLLPSVLYLPAPGEIAEQELTLPWGRASSIVGELARRLGAKVPARLVASAKSWICHGGVNRRAAILPWSAADSEPHVSPVEASAAYLSHLRAAWDAAHPEAPLADQDVVVTVPASFDDGARTLTEEAAEQAGLGRVRLLEEPQAAFYDFLGGHEHDLADALGSARLVLVVDVGGGTTDLTLLRVRPAEDPTQQRPELERIAVGGHLMLGGDNMDVALAHHVLQKAGIERRLDPTEWSALVQSTRQAKETLLAQQAPEEAVVSVQGRGSRLVASTRSISLQREEIRRLLLDGFMPSTGPAEVAARTGRAGLTTLGLPYATDPAIPRHICTFLRQHAQAAEEAGARVDDGLPQPDLLLLNGGVFNAPAMSERLMEVLAGWYGGEGAALLEHSCLDTAVARGAVRYGLARRGHGTVITGGTARAYYIGVEGLTGEPRAFCVAPRGMAEGATVQVPDRLLELVLDTPVAFPLYSYTGDRVDAAGTVVDVDVELEPLAPLETALRSQGETLRSNETGGVPVTLSATLDESGALGLYLVTVELPPRRWRLDFALAGSQASAQLEKKEEAQGKESGRGNGNGGPPAARLGDARRLVERVYGAGAGSGSSEPDKAKSLRRDLEELIGPRGEWSATTCRALWDAFEAGASSRKRSALHELTWLRLAGWCLRPGFGHTGDAERMGRLWALHAQGLRHPSKASWADWWLLWRRVAPGLGRQPQQVLFEAVRPWLCPEVPGAKPAPPAGPRAYGHVEMLQLLAALERLPASSKSQAGEWFVHRAEQTGSWLPLGRLGAREPFSGEARDVVDRAVAEQWLQRILALDWTRAAGAALAATLLAQVTGDPQRDLDPSVREAVLERLKEADAPGRWGEMVNGTVRLTARDAKALLGDALPVGLRLV